MQVLVYNRGKMWKTKNDKLNADARLIFKKLLNHEIIKANKKSDHMEIFAVSTTNFLMHLPPEMSVKNM